MRYIVYIVGFLRLQVLWVKLLRFVTGEAFAPKAEVPTFESIDQAVNYIYPRFEWRPDRIAGIPVDWVTHPEVTQARLKEDDLTTEDCDGYHYWMTTAMAKMPRKWKPYVLSIVWREGFSFGGHAVSVAEQDGFFHLVDYRRVGMFATIEAAVAHVLFTRAPEAGLFYWALQNTDMSVVKAGS